MDKSIEKRRITQPEHRRKAKGGPGTEPRWASGAKTLVGTATAESSRIWFTINNGAIAEVYHPDVDQANTRSVRFLVTGPDQFFSDEIWDADHRVEWMESGVPGCRVHTQCKRGRYVMSKEIVTDPLRDVLLLRVTFTPADGQNLRLYLAVDPHIGDKGAENQAWAGAYKGVPMLFACREQVTLAVACEPSPKLLSVGYMGTTDAYTLLSQQKPLPSTNITGQGNVALGAELDLQPGSDGSSTFTVVLACGNEAAEAGQQARAGLRQNFTKTRDLFVQGWHEEQSQYAEVEDLAGTGLDMYRVSTAVLETHQSKRFPGGFVASLSLPWGFERTDKDIGGYHVVWPRDLVETAMGKLASGDARAARSTLFYLACTQNEDGGWSQNMWLDGTPELGAIQMDGIALPVLLADKLRRDNALDGYDPNPMMHAACCFVLRHGPVTQQDRWETTPGYSPYTMAVQVAALLAGADCADLRGAPDEAQFLRETADAWNDSIDELTYVEGTELAKEHGVQGYYMRMTPPERIESRDVGKLKILMPNHPFGRKHQPAVEIVSPDALALVRFGLRAADDPRMLDTLKVIDATLRRETRTGPTWKRSTRDGYGEKPDGSAFKKSGEGRGWPLLAGERGHYEIAAGHRDQALELLKTMARQTSECGMLPEQVWDAEDIPSRQLYNGHPTGSGMPLVWAHAEYIKLLRSLHANEIWDAVPQATARYVHSRHPASFQIWRPEQRRAFLTSGKDLRIDLRGPAKISARQGRREFRVETKNSGLGLYSATLPLAGLGAGEVVRVWIEPVQPAKESKADASQLAEADAFLVRLRSGNGERE